MESWSEDAGGGRRAADCLLVEGLERHPGLLVCSSGAGVAEATSRAKRRGAGELELKEGLGQGASLAEGARERGGEGGHGGGTRRAVW